MPRYTRVLLRIFPTGAKRFRVTPGRPQELISRRQLYGDRCFGNKSSGITEAHSLSLESGRLAARTRWSAMGFAYFTLSVYLSLSPFLSVLSVRVQRPRGSFILLPSCFVSGTIFNSYGAQSKLPMNINARAKSSQLKVAHRHFRPNSSWESIVTLFLTEIMISIA